MAAFSLYTRSRKKGKPIYYAQFKTADRTWSTAKSTGCTTRRDAELWCEDFLQSNGNFMPGSSVSFMEFTRNFFSWDGEWATDKKVSGKRISQRHCIERNDMLRNHVLPVFGPMKLTDIDSLTIKAFKNDLYREGKSGSLINKCLCILRAILNAAEERNLIKAIPKIQRAVENPKIKGILALDEVNHLFKIPWMDYRGYVGNLLAASTGLRLGEIQALTIEDIHLNKGYISIHRSWDNRLNMMNETTKTGRSRTVFIPHKVIQEIECLVMAHPSPTPASFLFFGEIKQNQPADKKYFVKTLYRALRLIGIDESERKKRNITFHSWRHWYNSLLINARIPLQKVQALTGHLTHEMSQHYYHVDDMTDVKELVNSIFEKP